MSQDTQEFQLGLEACIAERPAILDGARFGLLMNRASVDRQMRFACDVLVESFPGQLVALFTPQHGLWGDRQANMVESPHSHHPRLDIPIYSLYSETRRPTPQMLSEVDCLVVDLQDVGTRVYTFVWTVLHCLRACARADILVLILDRPNPIGGVLVEGPLLDEGFRSFVGGACIPMRHGLTIGELAVLLNTELRVDARLAIVPMRGWSRSRMFASLNRHWIPPSPNLPRFESAVVYPGQVLLEGTNLSEGRGTTTPFEIVGAPFIDPDVLYQAVSSLELPGVVFLPVRFTPKFDKWSDRNCGGVSLHVSDANAFRPYRTTVAIMTAVRRHWPTDFAWRDPPYEYETTRLPIDIISGSSILREQIDRSDVARSSLDRLTKLDEQAWHQRTISHLLYSI